MAEPSLSPLAHSRASPNRISDAGDARAPCACRRRRWPARRIAEQHPVDAEVESVQVLDDGCAAEQHERETDEPGEGPQAAEGQAEQPDARGDGTLAAAFGAML